MLARVHSALGASFSGARPNAVASAGASVWRAVLAGEVGTSGRTMSGTAEGSPGPLAEADAAHGAADSAPSPAQVSRGTVFIVTPGAQLP